MTNILRNHRPIPSRHARVAAALLCAATLSIRVAVAAPVSPAAKCEAGKNDLAGKQAACLQKAEANFVKSADAAKYGAARIKCDTTFASKWAKLETAAGGACPTTGDEADIGARIGDHSATIASLLSGAPTAICGNGVLDAGEDCELGTLEGGSCPSVAAAVGGTLACAPGTCTYDTSGCRTWARAFVTSTTHLGTFGGVAGGDAICQGRADAAGLGGTWRAWLSDSATNARDHIDGAEYRLVDDTTVVATSWSDLVDGTLAANIDLDEHGAAAFPNVWTGTNNDGTAAANCGNWTGSGFAAWGANDFPVASGVWSTRGFDDCSSLGLRLYCFEQRPVHRIFVTSTTYNGDLGGLAGADAKCQARAHAGGLGGTWRAWLSTSTVDAKDRIPDVEYRRLDGGLVALDEDDLLDGAIAANVTVNELGGTSAPNIWTGTRSDGTSWEPYHCNDWTTSAPNVYGVFGKNDFGPDSWTAWINFLEPLALCNNGTLRLYCFEQ